MHGYLFVFMYFWSMKTRTLTLMLLLCISSAYAQDYSGNLVATDDLGRVLPEYQDVGPQRDKLVGLFYWTWHTKHSDGNPQDVTKILSRKPSAVNRFNDPIWPTGVPAYFWGEPLLGYYKDTDKWVLRKHAEMLADAGVDALFFDCTNGSFTWEESYMALCEVFAEARKDGVKTPQIAFMLAFGPSEGSEVAIKSIYEKLYRPGLYEELWFKWEGKPVIMAYPEMLDLNSNDSAEKKLNNEIRNFFTFRPGQPVYNMGPERTDHWGWLEIYPQHGFGKKPDGTFEQVTVGVSQNWSKELGLSAMNSANTFGRSYTHQKGEITTKNAVDYGYNFQEQWDRALEIDPQYIFVTGWNEWIAGRHEEWMGQENAFPDQFSQEKSRDIEPMVGGHGDNYYYQLIANIRKFKGVAPIEKIERKHTIQIDGSFAEWEQVLPAFKSHKGSTLHRDSEGWGDLYYRNTTGRNDFVQTKVAHDDVYVYFYIETAETITPSTDPAWMRLLINTDRKHETGWEGYDYIINRVNAHNKATVEKHSSGWDWKKVGEADFAVKGNQMEFAVAKSLLGIEGKLHFEIKWSDNMQDQGVISDFYIHGDVAPSGRFNYLITE